MSNIARIFRDKLPEYQSVVESQLEVSLGDLKPLPIWTIPFREIGFYEKKFTNLKEAAFGVSEAVVFCLKGYFNLLPDEQVFGMAGNRGVYYGKYAADNNGYNDKECEETLLHELYHVGLARYAGYDNIFAKEIDERLSELMDEAFCELMAIRTLRERKIKLKSDIMRAECVWLSSELKRAHVSAPRDIANFVLNHYKRPDEDLLQGIIRENKLFKNFEKRYNSYQRRAYH